MYFWFKKHKNENVGACEDLGPTALAFLGYLLIGVGVGA
jgi:hypothetical protein